jgi:hypothetical protein
MSIARLAVAALAASLIALAALQGFSPEDDNIWCVPG